MQTERKTFEASEVKAAIASPAQISAINRLAPVAVDAADVFVGHMALANDRYDRAHERFPKAYLQRFAETLPGKSVLQFHDHNQPPVGRFFDAEVRQDGGNHILHASYYMDSEGAATRAVRMGIAKHVSIGYRYDTRVCDLCGKDYDGYEAAKTDTPCNHVAGRIYDGKTCTLTYGGDVTKAEAIEGSFVGLGCQYGAETVASRADGGHAAKAAHFDSLASTAGKGDAMEKELEELRARLKSVEAERDALKAPAADGEAYRAHLKAEIVRLHTSMEEAATGAAIVKALDAADAKSLDEVRKEVDARHAKHFAPRPGADTGIETKSNDEPFTPKPFNPAQPMVEVD